MTVDHGPEESEWVDNLMARIGSRLDDTITRLVIDVRDTRRFAHAVNDLNPVYFDEMAAQTAGYRTIIAPPTFIAGALQRVGRVADLDADGRWVEAAPVFVGRPMVFGGEAWRYGTPLCVGDEVTVEARLGDVNRCRGRSGPFVRVIRQTVVDNQFGERVVEIRRTGIIR